MESDMGDLSPDEIRRLARERLLQIRVCVVSHAVPSITHQSIARQKTSCDSQE